MWGGGVWRVVRVERRGDAVDAAEQLAPHEGHHAAYRTANTLLLYYTPVDSFKYLYPIYIQPPVTAGTLSREAARAAKLVRKRVASHTGYCSFPNSLPAH